jgi:hypothetical protein
LGGIGLSKYASTRTPYRLDFAGADGGKNAHYLLPWVNPTGEKGPWSETATATIARCPLACR